MVRLSKTSVTLKAIKAAQVKNKKQTKQKLLKMVHDVLNIDISLDIQYLDHEPDLGQLFIDLYLSNCSVAAFTYYIIRHRAIVAALTGSRCVSAPQQKDRILFLPVASALSARGPDVLMITGGFRRLSL